PEETKEAVRAYLARRPHALTEQLFLNRDNAPLTKGGVYHAFKKCLASAGLRDITIHTLRSTFIHDLVKSGAAPHKLHDLTGNRSMASLNPYFRLAETKKKNRKEQQEERQGQA